MRGFALVTGAVSLCFAAASPSEAKKRPKAPPGYNPALSGIGRVAPTPAPPLPSNRLRVQFTNDSIIRYDGTPADRRALVGTIPLMGPVAAELGLFSVTGASTKERELRKTDPVADVQPRRSKVAAVGLRMRF
ncbi:MAG TPA: hypothetical protein VGB70_04140 [Allosphingosinicella sp.]|jgi:hypothetical protein